MPRLTVCIPTYNRKKFLEEALQSLKRQTFQDFEIVILDDGSTDGTAQMVKQLGGNINYIWQENAGEVATTNRLIELAQTDYISFLHSDDLLVDDAMERLWAAVEGESEPVVAYGNYYKIDENANICGKSKRKLYSGYITEHLFADIIVHPVGSLFPKKVLQQAGGLDSSITACYDYKMELLISLKYRFIAVKEPTFMRRRHSNNTSQISFRNRLTEYEVLKDFYCNLGGQAVVPFKTAMKRLAKEAYRAGRSAVAEGKKEQGKMLLKESWQIKHTPKTFLHLVKESAY